MTGKPEKRPETGFVADKFIIERTAIADKRLSAGQCRFLLHVLHESWPNNTDGSPRTRMADESIMDDVPGHATQSTCYRTRAFIASLGYWTYAPGSGITATVYYFKRDPAPHVLALLKVNEERRKGDVKTRLQALLGETETLQSQHKSKRQQRTKKLTEPLQSAHTEPLQIATQPCVENAGMSYPYSHPQEALPLKEVAQEPPASPPAERNGSQRCEKCGRPATGHVGGDWYCDRHHPHLTQEPDAYWLASRGE